MIEIGLLGDKNLENMLRQLPNRGQKTAVNKALRASAKRLRPKLAAATPVDQGRLKKAMEKAKIRAIKRRNQTGVGIALPMRAELGIPADAKGYYPTAIEYGFYSVRAGRMIPAQRFIRNTVDTERPTEIPAIGRDLGRAITEQARKEAAKKH